MKKSLAICIIVLLIGSIATSSITLRSVHASSENNLRVTVEICGGKGSATHTVIVTTQQYQEIEHRLETITERLRGGTVDKETLLDIQDMIIILGTNRLLPNGISSDQAQRFITGPYADPAVGVVNGKGFLKHALPTNQSNSFCLISGTVHDGYVTGPLGLLGAGIAALGLILKRNITAIIGFLLMGVSNFITTISPVSLGQRVTIKSGEITSVGLSGVKTFNISSETGEGIISGFSGIKITRNDTKQMSLLGVALSIKL
jgi:hypothetical protein